MDALDNSFYNNSFYNGFLLNNDLFSDVFVPLLDTQSELAMYNPEAVSPISSPDDFTLQCQANDSMYLPAKATALKDPTCIALPCAPRKRGRPPLDKTARKCTNCGTNSTPEWRKGPSGPHTLCNACGLHFMKSQRKERHARKKQALKAEAEQKVMMEVNAQGMVVSPKSTPSPQDQESLLQAQQAQAEAEARAYSLAHAQAQAQFQAQQAQAQLQAQAQAEAQAQAQFQSQEEAEAIEAQNQAQIHAQIQAFLNASDSELQMPSLPSPALCFQENALAHDPRLQAAFASLSAALQLTPDSFHLMSGGANM